MRLRFPGVPFECLLVGPEEVIRQDDPAAGCAPACLEMVMRSEGSGLAAGGDVRLGGLSEQCASADSEEPGVKNKAVWRTSPAAVCSVLNALTAATVQDRRRLRQYHVVHGDSIDGPLGEVLSWLRGASLASGWLALPSLVLTRHGAHWMLAAGARVDADGSGWLALADPAAGRLVGVTPDGLAREFTRTLVGDHPDWFSRHVAVVPSVLPRRRPCTVATVPSEAMVAPVPPPGGCGAPMAPLNLETGVSESNPPPALADPVVAKLVRFACEASAPAAVRWLAPLRRARSRLAATVRSSGDDSDGPTRWLVVDDDGGPVAEVLVAGPSATLLEFCLTSGTQPGRHGAAAG